MLEYGSAHLSASVDSATDVLRVEVDDRVADELAWTMIRRLPAALRGHIVGSVRPQPLALGPERRLVRLAPAGGEDGPMLEQEQQILVGRRLSGRRALQGGDTTSDERLLQLEADRVRHTVRQVNEAQRAGRDEASHERSRRADSAQPEWGRERTS